VFYGSEKDPKMFEFFSVYTKHKFSKQGIASKQIWLLLRGGGGAMLRKFQSRSIAEPSDDKRTIFPHLKLAQANNRWKGEDKIRHNDAKKTPI
jgi:hypothetical protein